MSLRPARTLGALALLTALALCIAGCGRHVSSPKPAATAAAPHGVMQHAGTSAAPGGATAANDNGPETVEGSEEDHPQEQSDRSLEHLAALPPEAQLPAGRWKAGVNYTPLLPAQTTHVPPGKVEVLEVFWLGCPHCYALEPALQKWLHSKPAYVEFVRVPVMWGPVHRLHAHLYYTLLALGHEDLVQKVFDTIQHGDVLIGSSEDETEKAQQSFATANGISATDFANAYKSPQVLENLQHAQELTQRYQVNAVPLMVVDGKYSTDPSMAGSAASLFSLVDDLAAAEHTHGGGRT